ncbi:hypothetical protein PtrM4_056050 [Pyrenophora tritici-repentis]|uniref:HTH CENPB-type domain-containing protein n=1 Tax=Pyrenophora tritici-repentis TaxID=45151 RepID=A0A834VTX1_9PLEO|nr:hypothetical protein PtrM4_056050 [Pyrenophora tritici-repentis]KAI1507569.1 hypothetical protein Ptr86124_013503 [Pyrenophora tritici-repentis]KAI1685728.1 hypothetical protein KJE20_03693 [Pyrenophora tritici-repentis]
MANRLLRERGGEDVGKNWVDRFIQRNPELRTRRSRPYDRQRAACEDPVLIKGWFELVQNTKAKYGIIDEDMYNFDETGFIMGKILSQARTNQGNLSAGQASLHAFTSHQLALLL